MEEVLCALEEKLILQFWDSAAASNEDELAEAGIDPLEIDEPATHARVWELRVRNMLRGEPHPYDQQPQVLAAWYARCKQAPLFDAASPRGHPYPWMFARPPEETPFSEFFRSCLERADHRSCDRVCDLLEESERHWRALPGNASRTFFVAVFARGDVVHVCVLDDGDAETVRARLALKHHELELPLRLVVRREGAVATRRLR